MNLVENLTEKTEMQAMYDLVCKVDRILRLYRNCKKVDENTQLEVKERVRVITDEMK